MKLHLPVLLRKALLAIFAAVPSVAVVASFAQANDTTIPPAAKGVVSHDIAEANKAAAQGAYTSTYNSVYESTYNEKYTFN